MPEDFLKKIVEVKKQEIKILQQERGLSFFEQKYPLLQGYIPGSFNKALSKKGLSLIAEIKKASPSKGVIRSDFDPVELAQSFESSKASALSVLTEKVYFLGDPEYIKKIKQVSSLPVLRKDFIIDPIQVYESKHIGADAILLIKAILTAVQLRDLMQLAHRLGLDVLVEIHSQAELDEVFPLGCPIIGINNRDLSTFEVDLNTSIKLGGQLLQKFPKPLVVAESGYSQSDELTVLLNVQFSGVLIGEGLAIYPDLVSFFKPIRPETILPGFDIFPTQII